MHISALLADEAVGPKTKIKAAKGIDLKRYHLIRFVDINVLATQKRNDCYGLLSAQVQLNALKLFYNLIF